MKTWDDLDTDQKLFIKRYLKKSPKDLFRKRSKSSSNRAIIGAFGVYADLVPIFDTHAGQVPADYPERVPVMNLAGVAADLSVDGKFVEATRSITSAISAMEDLRVDLTNAAARLRDSVAPVSAAGFLDADIAKMEAGRQAVLQHLTDPLPTFAQMTAARAAYEDYQEVVDASIAAMGDVPAAAAALEQAKQLAHDTLEETANLDNTPYATTPQAAGLAEAVEQAEELQFRIITVPTADSAAMRSLADDLNTFVRSNAAALLTLQARQTLADRVTAHYNTHSPALQAVRDADLTALASETEHAGLIALQALVAADIVHIDTHINTREPDEIAALAIRIDESAERAARFETQRRVVDIRLLKAKLAGDGAKEAHQDGIIKLMETNGPAAEKVMDILARDAAILNGTPATPDFIRAQAELAKTLGAERTALVTACNEASAKTKELEDEIAAILLEKQNMKTKALTVPITDQDREKYRQLGERQTAAGQELAANKQEHIAKYAEWGAKDAEVQTKEQLVAAARNQRAMLDAVTFGPLSPVAARPIPDSMVADVVDLFGRNPDLAAQTCLLAPTAKDPESLAKTAKHLADQCETGFAYQAPAGANGVVPPPVSWGKDTSDRYASDLLKRAAYLGPDFSDQAQDAIARGVHHERNPDFRGDRGYTEKEAAAIRTTQAADAMMQTTTGSDGKITVSLDLNDPGFAALMERQKFSQLGQYQASTMANEETDKLKAFFDDPTDGAARKAKAEDILNSVTDVPSSPAARDLLVKSLGIPATDFDDPTKAEEIKQKVRTAILKSMCTPVAQADVGSCFATAPLRKMRDEDPLAVMEMYRDVATTGVFNPKHGRPIPAVVNVPAGDDPLTRSVEYSVAAASAQMASSRERNKINAVMIGTSDPAVPSVGNIKTVLSGPDWAKLEPELAAAVLGGFTFTYDPTANASGASNDGSSDKGFMRMVALDTKQPILSQAEFVQFIERGARAAVQAAGLPDTERDLVLNYIRDPAFIASIDTMAGKDKPWDMDFGGYGDEAGDVMFDKGGNKRSTSLVDKDPSDSEADRAVKVLKTLGGLGNSDMTMISTSGMHAFNALPPEGAYKALMTGNVDDNIRTMLTEPGRDIADTELPVERAVYLYDKQMEQAVLYAGSDAEKDLVRAAFGDRPTAPMTPAALEAHISSKLDAAKTAAADRKATEWAGKQTTPPSPTDLAKKKTDLKADQDALFKNVTTRTLTQELGVPEFVVADPNWGDETNHKLFVIAPDPLTGEARLWQKSVIGGELWPLDEKWLKANWRMDQ